MPYTQPLLNFISVIFSCNYLGFNLKCFFVYLNACFPQLLNKKLLQIYFTMRRVCAGGEGTKKTKTKHPFLSLTSISLLISQAQYLQDNVFNIYSTQIQVECLSYCAHKVCYCDFFFLAVNSLVLAIYYYESCKMAFMKVTYWANKCLIIANNLLLLDFKCQYSKAYIFPLSFGGSISGG